MIYSPEFPLLTQRFPTDKCLIVTFVRLKDVVGDCLPHELDTLPPEIRHLVHHKTDDADRDHGTVSGEKYNPTVPTCRISIRGFYGITLHAEKEPGLGWVVKAITFNPGRVCHGHNGRVTEEEHFVHACSDLIESVAPLLEDSDDAIHLVPGLHPKGRGWWKSLEILFQVLDPEGLILGAFTNAKHKEINKKPVYLCHDESIAFANSTGDLVIRVYRKDLELRKKLPKGKDSKVTTDTPVLRIEVQLSGDKLEQHFKGGRRKVIEGKPRLVSFRASDLRAAFRSVMSGFSGVYAKPPSVVGQRDNKIGRMMGWVAEKTGLPVEHQIAYYSQRFLANAKLESKRNAKSKLGIAARKELSLQSTVNLTDLFGDDAWHYQPAVACEQLEAMIGDRHMDVTNHPLVQAAYGTIHRSIHPSYGSRANA